MTPHFARSLTASFGLHAAVAGVALILFAISPRVSLPPEPLQIITLLPGSAPGPAHPPVAEPLPSVHVSIPQPAPASTLQSDPEPVAPPTPQPRPVRPTAPPKNPSASSTSSTKPPAPTSGRQMTRDEFIATYGPPKTTSSKQATSPVKPPRIVTDFVRDGLTPGSPGSPTADPRFNDALIAKLRAAFMASGSWPDNLAATVSFTIGADGKLRAIKLERSSGLPVFDAAALNACRETRMEAVHASEAGQSRTITFRAVAAP